ncbi:MAG: PBP1A family penicillin-binding protein [Clostridia bacterium]|nr:PBP1A family penicillin-binding protein [Clostridia bacterium]
MRKKKVKTVKKKHTIRHLLLGILLMGMSFIFFVGIKVCELDAWHEFDPNKILNADETLILYNSDSEEICTLHLKEDRITVPLSSVPKHVQKAFISAEDARFYEHIGIDIIRIAGAALEDIKSGGYVQGASTITQQLIKLSHLSSEKTMQRKAEEAVLAYLMEKEFTKDEILGMYLNYVYFGGGFYGIEAAARGYFGIHASELSTAQGAVLAGILKSPSAYAPHLDFEASMGRKDNILSLMHEYGHLTDSEYASACAEEIELHMTEEADRSYYIDYAIDEACRILGISNDELLRGGYRIYTAQDSDIQDICDRIYSDDDMFPAKDVQSAIAVVDTETGEIDALIGGRGKYSAACYNRAVNIRRQPGSVIKPLIVYAPAMEYYGYTAASVIADEPRSFGAYTPKNSGNKYYGNVTLRRAIKGSLNIPAVTVLNDIGVESGKKFASQVGIEFESGDNGLSLALGGFTKGVSPLQIANAYGAVCDGLYTESSAIASVEDKYGNVLYTHSAEQTRVLSEANAYILTNMLCSVASDGTGRRLSDLGFDVACKTGTVSVDDATNRDAWIAAYTREHAVAVWIGYDSAKDGVMESSVTGGSYPADIVKKLFEKVYEENAPEFVKPDSVVRTKLDVHSVEEDAVAALATLITPEESVFYEYFASGTEPDMVSRYWSPPVPPNDFMCTGYTDGVVTFSFTSGGDDIVYELYRRVDGAEKLVGTYSGREGQPVICTDDAARGKTVSYFIRPYRERQETGVKLEGASSVQIVVQFSP